MTHTLRSQEFQYPKAPSGAVRQLGRRSAPRAALGGLKKYSNQFAYKKFKATDCRVDLKTHFANFSSKMLSGVYAGVIF